jgi:hypothetical protein
MRTDKTWDVTDEQFGLRIALDNCCERSHVDRLPLPG